MDGRDDFLKATGDLVGQDSFSSKTSNRRDVKIGVDDHQGKQTIATRIAYGEEIIPIAEKFAMTCKNDLNMCIDKTGPSIIANLPETTNWYGILRRNSVKIRIVTEITSDNLRYCNQIIDSYGIEIRHLPNIKGNIAISDDKEFIASAELCGSKYHGIIHSNIKEVVEQNQLVFETFWKNAIPAEQKIREIEMGVVSIQTYLINTNVDALAYAQDFVQNADSGFSNSTSMGYFELLDKNKTLLQAYLNHLSSYKEGKVKGGIRWVTHLGNNRDDIKLIKKFLDLDIEIRHVRNLPPLFFSVSQKQCVTTVEDIKNGEMFQRIIYSTEPLYILHYQKVFEELWDAGIDAKERIRQIEAGAIFQITKVIENPIKTKKYFIDLVRDARGEILILFPSLNAVKREVIMGIIDLLKEKGSKNIRIRILSPANEKIKELLLSKDIKGQYEVMQNILSREIRKQENLISTIVIVDRKYVLATELKDDSKELFEEAIGVSTYSTSTPTVLSYVSIFESLWDQTEMSDDLKKINKKLIQSEQLEREFINTAAHELRTPTQAVMGYAELDKEVFEDLMRNAKVTTDDELKNIIDHLKGHFDAISRNSARLDELINNLLDVARIESSRTNSLQIRKEKLDLAKEINDSINTELGQKIKNKDIEINLMNECINGQCWIYADKSRLKQIINNLVGNAIKFTNQNGKIDITIKENAPIRSEIDIGSLKTIVDSPKSNNEDNIRRKKLGEQVLISISDTGRGIPPLIMP
ncbi:MAG: HAMP domain-containing sensor histidine kinase, partial [Candidatus Nitrosocosmicus sp.]|nr:HAMP domain-containing sensor histidine kinase [Candidatus Nitrosocosmicus sp.]